MNAELIDLDIATVGIRIELGTGLERIADELRGLWRHSLRDSALTVPDARLRYVARGLPRPDGARPLTPGEGAGYQVSGDVTRLVIERLIGRRILVHAGVVDHPRLGTVVIVGPSGAGKSTAVRVLGRQGRYLTDELGILDPETFSVTGYPKPVSLLDPSSGWSVKRDIGLDELELTPAVSAGPPQLLVLLDRITGGDAAIPAVERVPLNEALPLLIEQTSSLARVPDGLARLATLAASTGGVLRVRYREAAEIEGLLSDLPDALMQEWLTVDPSPRSQATAASRESTASRRSTASRGSRASRGTGSARSPESAAQPADAAVLEVAPFVQAVIDEQGIVILTGSTSLALQGLTAMTWDEIRKAGSCRLQELIDRVTAHIGPHPQAQTILEAVLADLQGNGLVVSR